MTITQILVYTVLLILLTVAVGSKSPPGMFIFLVALFISDMLWTKYLRSLDNTTLILCASAYLTLGIIYALIRWTRRVQYFARKLKRAIDDRNAEYENDIRNAMERDREYFQERTGTELLAACVAKARKEVPKKVSYDERRILERITARRHKTMILVWVLLYPLDCLAMWFQGPFMKMVHWVATTFDRLTTHVLRKNGITDEDMEP